MLGRINADKPIGGQLARLDVEAARAAILTHIGKPLSLSAEASAEAIVRIANAKMAGAIRLVSVERGHDPTRFVAVPFGGGGALHAGALIRDVGLNAALVPRYPGITSALGCIIADVRHDRVATVNLMLDGLQSTVLELAHKKKRPVFVGGFYSRSTTNGCEARVDSHAAAYYDYSLGTRCCMDAAKN